MTHAQAVALVRGKTNKTSRKIGNNIWGQLYGNGDVGIILHLTQVVTIHADGTYTLNSNGWRTAATKRCMCKYCQYYVTQRKGEWFVGYYDGERHHDLIPFEDGMRLSHDMFGELVAN